jgi:hypothetical protein
MAYYVGTNMAIVDAELGHTPARDSTPEVAMNLDCSKNAANRLNQPWGQSG